jgi:hypothetical protein
VTATVRARPRAASNAARSRNGIRWPCAGYGTTSKCGLPSPLLALVCVGMSMLDKLTILNPATAGSDEKKIRTPL